MSRPYESSWFPFDRVDRLIQVEGAVVLVLLTLASLFIYRFFLKNLSEERHQNLKELFKNVGYYVSLGTGLFVAYQLLYFLLEQYPKSVIGLTYLGLLVLLIGATVLVKTARILAFEYLFFRYKKAGVPVLIVNLFTLLLAIVIGTWFATEIAGIRLAPLLATSAIFSVVLGLALQDTLGNLFAGITLQFDKPYEIGDWVEVQGNAAGQRWVGEIREISWRATVMMGFADELITLPNRLMSSSQITNWSVDGRPIIRSHVLKIQPEADLDSVRKIILESIADIPQLRKIPRPSVVVTDITESWVAVKVLYHIDHYGSQLIIGDLVLSKILRACKANQIQLSVGEKIQLSTPKEKA